MMLLTGPGTDWTRSLHVMISIPALNEAESIGSVIDGIPANIDGFDQITVLVVDDGSSDETASIARDRGATVISHPVNRGLASAFRTALFHALEIQADVMIGMDADGQFDTNDLPNLIKPILSGDADFVTGDRFFDGSMHPEGMPPSKYWGNQLMSLLVSRITGLHFSDVSCGFRAYSREAILQLNIHGSFTYTQESFLDLAAKGIRITEVPVRVRYDPSRKSRVARNLFRYGGRTLLTILRTVRDHAPLKVIGYPGAVLALIGVASGMFVFVHYMAHGQFSPYIFVAFTSAYTFTLGIGALLIAFVADILRSIRRNQELILYLSKRRYMDRGPDDSWKTG